MKKFAIGTKQGMSRTFREDGRVTPVTVIAAGPCVITQVRTKEKDGYTAVQVGFGSKRKLAKPQAQQLRGLASFRYLREFRVRDLQGLERGTTLDVDQFAVGDKLTVTGVSKGRGFAGVVKRHGFGGSPASHGHKDQLRMPGSIGSTAPQRVFKGMRMAGRMGNTRVTVRNLEVVGIDRAKHELHVKGAVPGSRKSVLLLQTQEVAS